jgi:selenoprotein W-related protein
LAEDLKAAFNTDAELMRSSGGVFEVEVDGKLIFSKKSLDRFPDTGEIESLIRKG